MSSSLLPLYFKTIDYVTSSMTTYLPSLFVQHIDQQTKISNRETAIMACPGRYAPLSHGRTHYILSGPENGPLMVFAHGLSVFSFIWRTLVDRFVEQGYRVLTFDFYGHGWSAIPDTDYTIHLLTEQLEELIEYLGLCESPMVLVGHSMGALISCRYTSVHHQFVDRLILLNCAGISTETSWRNLMPTLARTFTPIFRRFTLLDGLLHQLGDLLEHQAHSMGLDFDDICDHMTLLDEGTYEKTAADFLNGSVPAQLMHKVLPQDSIRFVRTLAFFVKAWFFQLLIHPERVKVGLSIFRHSQIVDGDHSHTFRELGKRHHVAVLILWGEKDGEYSLSEKSTLDSLFDKGITPTHWAETLEQHIPQSRVKIVLDTDHSAFLQQPEQIFQEISRFVKGGDN